MTVDLVRAILETVHDAILVVDARSRIEIANERAERLLGYGSGQLSGHTIDEPGASLEATLTKSDRMRETFKDLELFHRGRRLPPLTFSAGAAAFPVSGATPEALVRAADAALYEAKHAGRDRTAAAHETTPQ